MDVINLSLGEPEIEPSRDIVVAGDRRAPPTRASCRSSRPATTSRSSATARSARPANAPEAITVAASTEATTAADVIAELLLRRADADLAAR